MKKLIAILSVVMLSLGIAIADYRCDITGNVSSEISGKSGATIYVKCTNHNSFAVNVTVPVTIVDVDGNACNKTAHNQYIEGGKTLKLEFRTCSGKNADEYNSQVNAISVTVCK